VIVCAVLWSSAFLVTTSSSIIHIGVIKNLFALVLGKKLCLAAIENC
jgi:hypothetical protein